jgi:hypothetical protein
MFFWTVLGMSRKVLRRMQHENQRIESVSRFFCESAKLLGLLVDLIGIEPMTSSMPWKRAPSCATGPLVAGMQLSHCRCCWSIRQTTAD